MSTVIVQARVQQATSAALDRIVAHHSAALDGARASRNSVAAAILDREAQRLAAALPTLEAPPPNPYREDAPLVERTTVPSDVDRLRRAMGDIAPGTLDKLAGVSKGTVRNCLRGAVPLASAGGGKLLAWVEDFEAKAGL